MKKYLIYPLFQIFSLVLFAQHPVKWDCISKKIQPDTYELQITASIADGWHINSQSQPESAIVLPTSISFSRNPCIRYNGKIKENGSLIKHMDETLGLESYQYENTVSFLQLVKLTGKVKTTINGTIEYQACTRDRCLAPASEPFEIRLN